MTAVHPLLDIPTDELARRPILDLAAQVWDQPRYECFRQCYRSMRRLDDLVDHRKELSEPIGLDEQQLLSSMLADWLDAVRRQSPETEILRLNELRKTFHLPLWPWERLVKAMRFDLSHRSFHSWLIFRRYTEGAAIAPAAVFIYLTVTSPAELSTEKGREIALPLAIFAYLVHIMRDLRNDLQRGLFYIPDTWLERYDLSQLALQLLFADGGEVEDARFAVFLKEYADVVRWFEQRAIRTITKNRALFRPDGAQSLWLIHSLYGQLAERLYVAGPAFDPDTMQPSGEEIRSLILELPSKIREDLPVLPVS